MLHSRSSQAPEVVLCPLVSGSGFSFLSNLATARLPLPSGATFSTTAAMLETIKDRIRALPGVTHSAFGNALPLVSAGGMTGLNVRLPRDPATVAKIPGAAPHCRSRLFRRHGVASARRALLSERDTASSQPVLVVNKSFADQYLGEHPVGRRLPLSLYRQAEWEIVGVVEDMKQGGLQTGGFVATADAAQPEMFSSYRQFGEMRLESIFFLARTDGRRRTSCRRSARSFASRRRRSCSTR